ncbi:MAG: hypothetical protein EON88_33245 [Brevundimonas sp.]|nr:MAG: hypothetical protein EON88_33245 [Brevundimonas sp.]
MNIWMWLHSSVISCMQYRNSGDWFGQRGATTSLTGVAMAVVRLAPGAAATLPVPAGRTVFCYMVGGEATAAGLPAPAFNLVQVDAGDIEVRAGAAGAVVLFGHADPIGEPVFAHGPFVMNTREEIVQAIADYNAGKFGAL